MMKERNKKIENKTKQVFFFSLFSHSNISVNKKLRNKNKKKFEKFIYQRDIKEN